MARKRTGDGKSRCEPVGVRYMSIVIPPIDCRAVLPTPEARQLTLTDFLNQLTTVTTGSAPRKG